MDLKSIFESLTPENIKKIPFVKTSMDVFIKILERNSEVSKRISALFDQTEEESDSEMVKRAKSNLRDGLYQTWILTLFTCVKNVCSDKEILRDLQKYGFNNAGLYQGANKIINPEFMQAHRTFTQKVGTTQSVRYMYYFAKYLETGEYLNDLVIQEKNPFVMNYEGSISKYMFRGTAKPLAHPIGWIDAYTRVITLIFHDYFGIEIFSSFNKIELQNFEDWVVFISDEDTEKVYKDFRTRINPNTRAPYTDKEIEEHVIIVKNKNVRSSAYIPNADGTQDIVAVFEDDTVIYHYGSTPQRTIFTTYLDYLNGFKEPINVYDEKWEFYADLASNFRFLYYDAFDEFLKEMHITRIKENNGGKCDVSIYMSDFPQNCFKIGGDAYPYTPGSDEQRFKTKNKDDVLKEYNEKFTTSFDFRLFRASYIIIEDDFRHSKKWFFDKMQDGTISLNTFGMQGFNYKITIDELVGEKYWFRCKGLNEFNAKIQLKNIFTENQILRISGNAIFNDGWVFGQSDGRHDVEVIGNEINEEIKNTLVDITDEKNIETFDVGFEKLHYNDLDVEHLEVIVSDCNNNKLKYKIEEQGEFNIDVSIDQLEKGDFRIDFFIKNNKNQIIYKSFYEGCDLLLYDDIEPKCSFLTYKERPSFTFDKETLNSVKDIEGTMSTTDYIKVNIGEKQDGSFAPFDERVIDYLKDGVWDEDALINKRIKGSLIEGNNFDKSFWWDMLEEETFIYKGFEHFEIWTSDHWIVDSSRFVTDTLTIELLSNNYYLYTEVDPLEDEKPKYLCSKDWCYLYTDEVTNDIILTFDSQGGYPRNTKISTKIYTIWDNIKNLIKTPTKDNCIFKWWSLEKDGSAVPNDRIFTIDRTIYAIWEEKQNDITK